MLLWLLMGFGHHTGPEQNYRTLPTQPAIAMPYDAGRLSPWPDDYTTSLPSGLLSAGSDVPAFRDYSSRVLVAQADLGPSSEELEQENLELRKRIEQLEDMIKGVVSAPPVEAPQPKVSADGVTKSVPGWVAEMYDWNKSGRLSEDPMYTVLTRSCPFNGTFAATNDDTMYIYRFQSTFRAKEQGRYVFAFDTTCGFDHQCTFKAFVDGGKIIDFNGNMDAGHLQNGIPLSVGDHSLEFVTYQNKNSYLNYRPETKYKWWPLIKRPGDLNAGEFRTDELFVTIPTTVNSVVRGCNY